MDMIFKGYLFGVLYALICLLFAFILYKVGVEKKITRKIVHILVGFEWVILYRFFGVSLHFLVVCILFLILLFVAHRKKLMPMISSDEDNAPGTVYYAVAMSVMALIALFVPDIIIPFGIGVFCTSLGDGLAGLVGYLYYNPERRPINIRIYGNKTLFGTICNFAVCYLVSFIFNAELSLGLTAWHCLVIAVFSTELELFTGRGLDNISITLGVSFLSYIFINYPSAWNYLLPILLTPLVIVVAYNKRALTVGGIIAALFVDLLISLPLGNFGFCILLSFFAGGVLVDKVKKHYKKTRQNNGTSIEKRGDTRDHVQVIANGLIASVCSVLYLLTSNRIFIIAFVAALAEAFADTAASGIGIISGRAYDLFRMRPCTPGLSGGVSLLGTTASVVAAFIISLIAFAFGSIAFIEVIIIFVAAVLGALFDSFLGSLLQVKYKCRVCGEIVEREEHCDTPTEKYAGLRIINNDSVNLLATTFSSLLAAILYYIIM